MGLPRLLLLARQDLARTLGGDIALPELTLKLLTHYRVALSLGARSGAFALAEQILQHSRQCRAYLLLSHVKTSSGLENAFTAFLRGLLYS
jgi:hypothetical protein